MNPIRPRVPLGELLAKSDRWVTIDPSEMYQQVTVRLWGQGVVRRNRVPGSEIRGSRRLSVCPGEFIVSRIDARNGAFGIVPDHLDGAVVSNDFPAFRVNASRLDARFLEWLSKTSDFVDLRRAASEGTTNRVRLKEDRFLSMVIALPPLDEQRRIVARIEELAAKIEEARALQRQVQEQSAFLIASAGDEAFQSRAGWTEASVGDLCFPPQYGYTESATNESVGPKFLRITDIQGGAVHWDTVPYCICPEPDRYLLQPGDLVFARTGATTGKSFLIRECPESVFASYLIRLRVRIGVSPEYLYRFFQSPAYWAQITEESTGTGQANVNGRKLAGIRVPVAPADEQHRIVAWLESVEHQVRSARLIQESTQTALESLLPSVLNEAFSGAM